MKIISFILALLQFLAVSLSIYPINTAVDYGGTYRPYRYETNMINIVSSNKTSYRIIISENAAPAEKTAASELQKYFEKMSGVTVPVYTDSSQPVEKEIIIGMTNRDIYKDIDFNKLGSDGFIMKASGNRLLITGGGERGVVYGVYAFLEEQLGCRWFTNDFEFVPELDTISFSKDLNDLQSPDFDVRRINYGWIADTEKSISFLYKSRTNVTFYNNYKSFGSGHDYVLWDVTMDRLVPDSLYSKDETLFAYDTESGKRTTQHICMSNPDSLKTAVKNAEYYIDNNTTGADHIHIGQKDNTNYCECENCRRLYEHYGSVSAPTILFANKLSEALENDGYDIYVTFYAYGETTAPPKSVSLKCSKKVIPVYCGTFYTCHSHPITECGYRDDSELNGFLYRFSSHEDTKISDELSLWKEIADRVYIYDYSINFINDEVFLSNLQTLQPNTSFMRDIGVTGYTYTCGSDRNTPLSELRNYLYSKIMWNADSDIEYYIDDFLKGFYGNAAPEVKKYLNYITAKTEASVHTTNTDWSYQSAVYTCDSFYIERLWKKAFSEEITDEQRSRLESVEIGWRYTEALSMAGRFFVLNPFRGKEQEKLYDDMKAHGINKVSSLSGAELPPKDEINFFFSIPQDWK